MKKSNSIKMSDGLLLLTAVIWGFAFVAQRKGMEFIGPFFYNGIRFMLGSLTLIPWLLVLRKKTSDLNWKKAFGLTLWPGLILFTASSLQQIGVIYTTAGNAGFITGLYVIIVPLLGLTIGLNSTKGNWIGAFLAVIGLYFLSVSGRLGISTGDILVFISAFFWAWHVIVLSKLVGKIPAEIIAFGQFFICGILSLIVAFTFEEFSLAAISDAGLTILYGGLMSVGVAYTLQVIAQKKAHPTHAAIILSMEGLFAVLGGWLILREVLTWRIILGCCLMLAGMLISQLSKKQWN